MTTSLADMLKSWKLKPLPETLIDHVAALVQDETHYVRIEVDTSSQPVSYSVTVITAKALFIIEGASIGEFDERLSGTSIRVIPLRRVQELIVDADCWGFPTRTDDPGRLVLDTDEQVLLGEHRSSQQHAEVVLGGTLASVAALLH